LPWVWRNRILEMMLHDHAASLGQSLPLLAIAPFVAMLLAIAILPLVCPHWWDPLRRKALVVALLSLPIAVVLVLRGPHELGRALHEYGSFVCLLGSLFVISGGIVLTGDLRATPLVNTSFLLIGAVGANLIGTTGASMLLIRPLLKTNSERHHTIHIPIFFIFLVSNIGGCLTPLGDPPLFLGFLRGVPFTWTLGLWPEWLTAIGALLLTFYWIDTVQYRREIRTTEILDRIHIEPVRIRGAANFAGLLGVLALVLWVPTPWRELGMVALAVAAYFATPRNFREANRFTFYPIQEVAILFLGIFVTMVPALLILEARGSELGIARPWQFFWATGGLSSFLDNAPTYLTFTSLAMGLHGLSEAAGGSLRGLVDHPEGAAVLRAISIGAVFMGANTYIGNGPNFMVKSICEERGVRMPSFFGYMLWSLAILVPLFVLITLIFFGG
jgi:Na+/H+ antiporter NhaD/arsenite permease-like protein